jgi:dihydroorotate dehydrogenase (fumarate)
MDWHCACYVGVFEREISMDTSTSYMGLRLSHPFVAGASPLGAHLDTAKRLEDAGWAAIVLPSLFEEQITLESTGRIRHMDPLNPAFSDQLAPFPKADEYFHGPAEYLEHLRKVKDAVAVPVIGSLNGTTAESWLRVAKSIEQAGADGLELNIYEVVTNLDIPGVAVEQQLQDVVVELKRLLRIPLAVKLSPFFTAFGHTARELDRNGADALVLFNRFYQPDIDVRQMSVTTNLELSRSGELPLRLRWLAILHGRVRASLIATGGVETPTDGIKALLAGAHAVQMASAILRHGPGYFKMMYDALVEWLEWFHIPTVEELRGRVSAANVPDPSAFERANYIRTLQSWGR